MEKDRRAVLFRQLYDDAFNKQPAVDKQLMFSDQFRFTVNRNKKENA